ERSPLFLTGRSHAIAVRAATLSVCSSLGKGTFAGKQSNGRNAPTAVVPTVLRESPSRRRWDSWEGGLAGVVSFRWTARNCRGHRFVEIGAQRLPGKVHESADLGQCEAMFRGHQVDRDGRGLVVGEQDDEAAIL